MLNFTRWKALAVIPIALAVCLVAVPIVFPEARVMALPAWAQRWLVLALDPHGNSSVLLEVDSNYVKKAALDGIRDDVRRALRDARIGYQGLAAKPDSVELRITDETKLPAALAKLRELWQPPGPRDERSVEIADGGGGRVLITVPQMAMTERMRQTVEQSIPIVERRINQLGTVVPLIQPQGANRILVEVLGLQDTSRLKELLGKTAKLEIRLVDTTVTPDQAQQGSAPLDSEVLMSFASPKIPYVVKKQVLVSGGDMTDAQPSFDRRSGEALVSFRFNTAGSRKFAQATAENVGQPFAIVLDNEVISAPIVREPITGGSGQISGNFTAEQANDLAILLRAGALPAPLTVIDERSKI
jgi:protein-export membrane protein SecD